MSLLDEAPVSGSQPPIAPRPPERERKKWLWPAVAASVIITAGAALALWAPWRKPPPTQAVRFEIGPAEKMTFINQASMAVSPDGHWMVFPAIGDDARTHYYIRALDHVEVRALPGADGNQSPAFWSYDSRWVFFVSGNQLKKVDIQGGRHKTSAIFPPIAWAEQTRTRTA